MQKCKYHVRWMYKSGGSEGAYIRHEGTKWKSVIQVTALSAVVHTETQSK
jgi:hypothetical protein